MNVVLFGTYYAVSKEALQRIDPAVFACAEMLLLLPVALALVLFMRTDLTREVWTRGSLLGSFFCGVLVLLAVALKHTSATATAFSPCLNGMLAALFSWLVLRRTISNVTRAAALLAVLGMLLMMADSPLYGGSGKGICWLSWVPCSTWASFSCLTRSWWDIISNPMIRVSGHSAFLHI